MKDGSRIAKAKGHAVPAISEARYRAIFDQSGQGIALMDSRFVLTAVNPAMCKLLGYEEHELLGSDYTALIAPGDLERQPLLLHHALSGEPVSLTRVFTKKDGTTATAEVSVRRISDDEVVMVYWDMTDSIATRESLNRERQRLATLFDAVPGPVWAIRPDMSLAAANATFTLMSGGPGRCFCQDGGSCHSWPCLVCPTRKVLEKGEPASHECTLPDGRVFLVNAVPFQDEDGQPLALGLAVDISSQKELARDLDKARRDAESAATAKSIFVAAVSHEIRTPLNAVLGLLQILEDEQLTPSQADNVDMALASGRLLMRLIDDLLDLSAIESGKILFDEEDFQLEEVLTGLRSMLLPTASARGLALETRGPDAWIRADKSRISQIAINLTGNAVKYTQTGSVRVSLGLESPHGQSSHMILSIRVADTGPGIPKDKQETIFHNFTRLHSGDRTSFGGVGLGLAIVKRLVGAMGGELSLDSAPGKGTTVRVDLPVLPPRRAAPPVQDHDPRSSRPLRILVVEDERVNQIVTVKALTNRGHQAEIASNGLEALEKLLTGTFDVVLMDVSMPVMDGLDAARSIRSGRAGEAAKGVPIVALTARADKAGRKICFEAGMNAFLPKPIDLKTLDKLLTRLTGQAGQG